MLCRAWAWNKASNWNYLMVFSFAKACVHSKMKIHLLSIMFFVVCKIKSGWLIRTRMNTKEVSLMDWHGIVINESIFSFFVFKISFNCFYKMKTFYKWKVNCMVVKFNIWCIKKNIRRYYLMIFLHQKVQIKILFDINQPHSCWLNGYWVLLVIEYKTFTIWGLEISKKICVLDS